MCLKSLIELNDRRIAAHCMACGTWLVASALVGADANAAVGGPDPNLTRILHQTQSSAREAAWATLFPEGPTLADSVLVLSDEVDDAHTWATRISAADRNTGQILAFGGFVPSGESAAVLLEGEEEMSIVATTAHGQVMSGLIVGLDGHSRAVIGLRVQIDIASLAAIVPVSVDLFVPFEFPADELAADVTVLEATFALASFTQEGDALGFDAPDPSGGLDPASACRAALADCLESAWQSMIVSVAAAWSLTGIAGDAALLDCMANATDDCDPACRALGCLLASGLAFAAAGDGSFAWTWAQHAHDVAECNGAALACIQALPSGPKLGDRPDVRPARGSGR
ncbi:MAG: hypothetical protein U0575_15970 [Phycisphaerales bacterium]|jgi:hypothetical protein